MTIGDVLAFVAGIGALCVSVWALLIGMALLCSQRAQDVQRVLETRAWRALLSGIVLAAFVGGGALALANGPNGALKLVGWALLASLLALGVLGGGGWVRLLANRVAQAEPNASHFSALMRGGALLIAAGLVPLVGWFLLVPLTILTSLGAAWSAVRPRKLAHRVLDITSGNVSSNDARTFPTTSLEVSS